MTAFDPPAKRLKVTPEIAWQVLDGPPHFSRDGQASTPSVHHNGNWTPATRVHAPCTQHFTPSLSQITPLSSFLATLNSHVPHHPHHQQFDSSQVTTFAPPTTNVTVTPEIAWQIFEERPPRCSRDGTFMPCGKFAQLVAARHKTCEKTVKDIWLRRSWRETTRPLWSLDEILTDSDAAATIDPSKLVAQLANIAPAPHSAPGSCESFAHRAPDATHAPAHAAPFPSIFGNMLQHHHLEPSPLQTPSFPLQTLPPLPPLSLPASSAPAREQDASVVMVSSAHFHESESLSALATGQPAHVTSQPAHVRGPDDFCGEEPQPKPSALANPCTLRTLSAQLHVETTESSEQESVRLCVSAKNWTHCWDVDIEGCKSLDAAPSVKVD
mmetsp:Transcript_55634/g.130356  ORF Transcript_55634/g.130356 Transcript_55634/m.130356 type:complete len:383 (-) Transcript_55634:84-1232(-)